MINALLTSKPANSFTELDPIAHQIRQEHQRCIHSPKTALIHACNAGVGLMEVRSKLSNEQWQYWLTTHCFLRLETAQLYMKMASHCSHFPQNLQLYSALQTQQNTVALTAETHLKDSITENSYKTPKNPFRTDVFSSPIQARENSHNKTISETEIYDTSLPVKPAQAVVKEVPNSALDPSPEAVIDVDFVQTPPPSSSSSKTGVIRFCLPGGVVPKARPRVTSNGTYLPQRYRAWRNQAEVELYRQMCELYPAPQFPLQKAAISLRFFGNHRTNSDIDNLAGACLDALTLNGAGILKDDRLSCLPQLSVEFVPGTPETGVWIEIEPLV
jgi:Holliday junction resolvase RusA-like endonuclease